MGDEKSYTLCDGLWGRADILAEPPHIHIYHDAIYLPWSNGGPWGVFDSAGRLIKASLNYRGPEYAINDPAPYGTPSSAITYDEVDTRIYYGFLNVHYGHFLINSLPRFWPVLSGRAPRALCHHAGSIEGVFHFDFAASTLGRLGFSAADLGAPTKPLRIKRLLVPDTSFNEQMSGHRIYKDMCDYVAGPFRGAEDGTGRPIYLSKTRLKNGVGRFEGEIEIETQLARAGIDIVYPELLTFRDQVSLLNRASMIVSTTGSALHTTIFTAGRKKIIAINQAHDVNSNFAIIDKLSNNSCLYLEPNGLIRETAQEFLTIHKAPDLERLARDLIDLIRETPL